MFHKLRGMSPFTICWVVFYTLVIAALIVPWDVGKWLAYAAFAPSLVLMLLCGLGIPLLIAAGLRDWAIKLYRAKRNPPEGER
jgi:Na+/H+ antiporter NhaC